MKYYQANINCVRNIILITKHYLLKRWLPYCHTVNIPCRKLVTIFQKIILYLSRILIKFQTNKLSVFVNTYYNNVTICCSGPRSCLAHCSLLCEENVIRNYTYVFYIIWLVEMIIICCMRFWFVSQGQVNFNE
jgi:hypothetical protein